MNEQTAVGARRAAFEPYRSENEGRRAPARVDDRRAAEHRFYLVACLGSFAVVCGGFGYTAHVRRASGGPALPLLVDLHGMLMAGWYVLFLAQVLLVRARRMWIHRWFGWFVAVWAASMVVVGFQTVRLRAGSSPTALSAIATDPDSKYWLLTFLGTFVALVGPALLLRRSRELHKRLMLLSCFGMVLAGSERLPLDGVPWLLFLQTGGLAGAFGIDLLMVYACIAYDTWRRGRLHPAWIYGTMVILAQDTVLLKTAGWIRLVTRLLS